MGCGHETIEDNLATAVWTLSRRLESVP